MAIVFYSRNSAVKNVLRSVVLYIMLNVCLGDINDESTSVDGVSEYCQHETMRGRCRWKSEVIVMTSARWGRMKTGRCLNIHPNLIAATGDDPMFLGCSADVLSLVDRKCSGRSECDIRIPDPDLDTVTPCYPDQKCYLEASYACVKVVQESRSCQITVISEQQFISSSSSLSDVNAMSSCGSKSHPWRLEAPVGQRINISLLDFTNTPRDRDVTCRQYGYVVEKSNKKNVSICALADVGGAKIQRESAVYTSETNSVDIMLATGGNDDGYNFLLRLNAVGCTNMIPPDNSWLKRTNNDILIGCYLSQQTWQLKCDGHVWKGQFGTCPETYVMANVNPVEVAEESVDYKLPLAMAVIAGGALIVCLTVIAIGIMCLQRSKRTLKKRNNYLIPDEKSIQRNGAVPDNLMVHYDVDVQTQ